MYPMLKRGIDFTASLFAIIILSPLLLPIMFLLKLTGEGEVFYLQERVGHGNKPFKIWKFATMLKNSPNLGTGDVTVKNDPRVLPMGKFLRKTKINELPQLINIFNGSMSIVGARPLMMQSFSQYAPEVKAVVYSTPPGLTGVGSIIFRDEESIIDRSDLPPREFYETYIIPYKGQLEVWYQQNKSLWLDFKLIFLTAWVVFFPNSTLPETALKNLPKRNF